MLDAYTLRKTIPRLIIVAIAITLSWPLLEFLVQLSNFLGDSLSGLLLAPFSNLHGGLTSGFATGASILAVLGGATIIGLGALGSLTFIFVAIVSLLVAFFTLVVRQILLILLVIISPLAILAYLLPNTEKFFKMWRKTLTSVLVVFPIITLFITAGQIFSKIALSNPTALNQIVAIIAYFIPYLLLPLAFRLAGDLMGALHGATFNKTGGVKKSLAGYRTKERQKHMNEFKTGTRVGGALGQTWLGNKFNNRTARLATGTKGRFGVGQRGDAAMAIRSSAFAREMQEKDPEFQQLGLDDNANGLNALSGGTEAGAREAAKKLGLTDPETEAAINTIKSTGGFSNIRTQASIGMFAKQKARLKGFQDYDSTHGEGAAYDLVQASANAVSGNNAGRTTAIMNDFSFNARQSGIAAVSAPNYQESYQKLDPVQISSLQPKSVQRYLNSFNQTLNDPSSSPDVKIQAARNIKEITNLHSGTSESAGFVTQFKNSKGTAKTLLGPTGNPTTIYDIDDYLIHSVKQGQQNLATQAFDKDRLNNGLRSMMPGQH